MNIWACFCKSKSKENENKKQPQQSSTTSTIDLNQDNSINEINDAESSEDEWMKKIFSFIIIINSNSNLKNVYIIRDKCFESKREGNMFLWKGNETHI